MLIKDIKEYRGRGFLGKYYLRNLSEKRNYLLTNRCTYGKLTGKRMCKEGFMANKEKKKWQAPYVSAATLSQFFDHIRYVSTPKKVDAGLLLDYGVSKGNVFSLVSALKFLGLVENDGTPTPAYSSLQVMGEEFISNLQEVVTTAYADLFLRLDVSRDSREHIRNYFARNYSPSQSEKATILFLDLCKEASIPVAAGAEPRKKGIRSDATTVQATRRHNERIDRVSSEAPTTRGVEAPKSDDELRREYIAKLIGQLWPPDTSGKDAEAIKAEAELRKAELDRIELLLKIKDEEEE